MSPSPHQPLDLVLTSLSSSSAQLLAYILTAHDPDAYFGSLLATTDAYIHPIICSIYFSGAILIKMHWNYRFVKEKAGYVPLPMPMARGKLEYALIGFAMLGFYMAVVPTYSVFSTLNKGVLFAMALEELPLAVIHSIVSAIQDGDVRMVFAFYAKALEGENSLFE